MTDNEIIKDLELWSDGMCGNCECVDEGLAETCLNAIDLINRQKAEIERLKTVRGHIDTLIHRDCEYPTEEAYNEAFQKALEHLYDNVNVKAEAYKECIEKVKALFPSDNEPYQYWEIHEGADNLLKELVGEQVE